MAEYVITDTQMTALADAVRDVTGGSGGLTHAQMVTELESVSTELAGVNTLIGTGVIT